jgi:2'-5' RNA ligase
MKFGIVIFPSKKLQDFANSYRKRYDPNYSLIPPHLTLKYAFEGSESDIKKMSEELDNIAKKYKPFPLHVYRVSSFYPVNNVIYLKVEPTDELIGLQKDLHSGYFESPSEFAFVPHITIGQKLSNDEHSDVLGQLKMLEVDHTEMVDRFHLLYQLENGSWTVYETFLLGEE